MKRWSDMRADRRPIEEKAFGLIFAMTNEQAETLFQKLQYMKEMNSKRAIMFTGVKS